MDAPLAHPISHLQDSYGVVVIGSGYGGAILAARLAQGRSLCILERGREWIPGSFPDALDKIVDAARSPQHPLGLYDYHSHPEVDVFVGSGLGGTSLINANVVIQPDSDLFDHPRWPDEIRQDRAAGTLEGYFAAVRQMLQTETYGDDLPALRKLDAHRKSTYARGASFSYLDVAVNLRRYVDQPNHVGVHQGQCTLCGDCITGCNVRAKNTLYMNYLPLAKQHGAQIFTQVEVDHLVKLPDGGYVVHYTYHPDHGQPSRQGMLRASVVILAAGALGSAEILLRSREAGLSCSEALGHYFSGNGDFLGAAYNTDQQTDVLGFGNIQDERAQIHVGPTILSMADYRGKPSLAERFILEEGAIPRGLVDTLRQTLHILNFTQGEDIEAGLTDYLAESQRIGRDLLHYDPQGALNHSMIYLGIGHDSADGMLVLDQHGRVRLLWGNAPDQAHFRMLSSEMRGHTAALGGTYIANPRWHRSLGRNLITVHPLGGCIMGSDFEKGVVDHRGRVYDPSRSLNGIHTGLFVVDGSIIPTAVGVNPLLTISGLAERIAALMNADATLDMTPKPFNRTTYVEVGPPVGLHFTEEMKGYCTAGIQGEALEDYREGERLGRQAGHRLSVWLWIAVEHLDVFLDNPDHEALVSGYVDYAPLGGKRMIERGRFNVSVDTPQTHTRHMRYSLQFRASDGQPYLLTGFKELRDDRGWDAWSDNTTLFTTIYRGTTPSSQVYGRGVIHVLIWDLVEQVASFRVHNASTTTAAQEALNRFGAFFFGELWATYVNRSSVSTPSDDRLETELEKSLREESNNPTIARRLIELKKRLAKYGEAARLYDILIHADPQNVAPIREKAEIYRKMGDERLYLSTLKQADELTTRSTFEENLGKAITIREFETKGLTFFGDFEWELQSHVNVLLGRNGYGKTHLLRALVAMLQYDEEIVPEFFQGSSSTAQMRVDINRESSIASTVRSSFVFDKTFGKVPVLAIPDVRYIDKSKRTIGVAEEKVTDVSSGGAWHFLRQESYEGLILNFLYDRCLDYFEKRTFNQPAFNLIQGVIKRLTSEAFEFREIKRLDNAQFEILVATEGNKNHPLHLQKASQGTLSIVAMFGMIYNFLRKVYGDLGDDLLKRQAIVVIDEIDSHLHPSWQQMILQLLRETFEHVQFIVTAHSPLVIAGCRRKEVAVLVRKTDDRFAVEVIPRHFIGATAAEIYTDVFNIEEKDQTYKDYDVLLPEKDEIRTRVAELKTLASRSPEEEKSLEKYQDDLQYLEEFPKVKEKREAKETIEDIQMAYKAKADELEGTKSQLQNLQEQARSADQADNELAATMEKFLNEQHDEAILAGSISDLLSQKNKLELAIPIREKVAELRPDNPSVLHSLAQDYLMARQYEKVISVSQQALEIAPDDIVSLRNLATGLWHTRSFEEAEKAYRKALQLHPDDLQSTIALARLLYTRQKFEEAAAVCRTGLNYHPHNEELTEISKDCKDEQYGERAEG